MDSRSNVPYIDATASEEFLRQHRYESDQMVQANGNYESNESGERCSVRINNDAAVSSVEMPLPDNEHDHKLVSWSGSQATRSVPLPQCVALDSNQKNEPNIADVPELTQILEIEPAEELRFTGSQNGDVITRVMLTNPTDEPVFYKLKKKNTTVPLRYSARPYCGAIRARDVQSVVITVKPQERDLAAEATLHKFMVQSCYAPQHFADVADSTAIDEFMKRLPTGQIGETKLQCSFV